MVDKFLQRTVAYDARMVEIVNRRGFMLVDVQDSDVTELAEKCLSALGVDER